MKIDAKIRDEKLQCDINREAAKNDSIIIWNTGKYEYLTEEEEILTLDQRRVIK